MKKNRHGQTKIDTIDTIDTKILRAEPELAQKNRNFHQINQGKTTDRYKKRKKIDTMSTNSLKIDTEIMKMDADRRNRHRQS